jgi:hypothetical protein
MSYVHFFFGGGDCLFPERYGKLHENTKYYYPSPPSSLFSFVVMFRSGGDHSEISRRWRTNVSLEPLRTAAPTIGALGWDKWCFIHELQRTVCLRTTPGSHVCFNGIFRTKWTPILTRAVGGSASLQIQRTSLLSRHFLYSLPCIYDYYYY